MLHLSDEILVLRNLVEFHTYLNFDLNFNQKIMNGRIKKIVAEKGFGFISVEGQEKDLFFHKNSLIGVSFEDLNEGDQVTFEIENSPKGPNAINVKRA